MSTYQDTQVTVHADVRYGNHKGCDMLMLGLKAGLATKDRMEPVSFEGDNKK